MSNDTYNYTNDLLDSNPPQVTYAQFWDRVGATIIDSLLISVLVLPISYFNYTDWKSPLLAVVMSILSMAYKPLMEFQLGATVGKRALKIKIVNYLYEKATLTEVLLRNTPLLAISAISLVLSLSLFSMPGFEDVDTYMEYATFVAQNQPVSWVHWISYLYYIADLVTYFAGDKKRTLHDLIGKTYAIKVLD